MHSTHEPADALELFGDLPNWWIAGGWAIDLWLGRMTREHADLDVATLRRDQGAFWERLNGWDLHLGVAPDVVEPWPDREAVPSPMHAVWCRPTPESPWAFELLLNDADGSDWLFRRDPAVRMPVPEIGRTSPDGIPYLVPEIVLLYKAKNVRTHDVQDFDTALAALDTPRRAWLREAIALVHPGHPWVKRLG
jgi:aminoglycoside-2''-adenylyltransferase